jgi:hypothetical protein
VETPGEATEGAERGAKERVVAEKAAKGDARNERTSADVKEGVGRDGEDKKAAA